MTYNSETDTLNHKFTVSSYINVLVCDLLLRSQVHDLSKLYPPEKEIFDKEGDKLKELVYGSEEYNESLKRLSVALKHHYEVNSHHPEHYENGIDGMDLLDLVEMICDWKASSQRNKSGVLELDKSFERFGFSEQLANIFRNTKERYFK